MFVLKVEKNELPHLLLGLLRDSSHACLYTDSLFRQDGKIPQYASLCSFHAIVETLFQHQVVMA